MAGSRGKGESLPDTYKKLSALSQNLLEAVCWSPSPVITWPIMRSSVSLHGFHMATKCSVNYLSSNHAGVLFCT